MLVSPSLHSTAEPGTAGARSLPGPTWQKLSLFQGKGARQGISDMARRAPCPHHRAICLPGLASGSWRRPATSLSVRSFGVSAFHLTPVPQQQQRLPLSSPLRTRMSTESFFFKGSSNPVPDAPVCQHLLPRLLPARVSVEVVAKISTPLQTILHIFLCQLLPDQHTAVYLQEHPRSQSAGQESQQEMG